MTLRTARLAVLLPATALLLAACGNVVAGGSGSDLPVLHIGGRTAAAADAGGTGPDDPYPLVGALPTGPASAPVHRYGALPVPGETVTRLAAALGLSGSAVRHAHGVVLASRGSELRVRDGGAWSFTRTDDLCPGPKVDVDTEDGQSMMASCAVGPAATTTPKPPADAKATAAPVLDAVGLASLPARTDAFGDQATVTVDPPVGGAATSGVATSVTVDAAGVRTANGVVGVPAEGPAYPLVSATDALALLRAMPRPAIACAIGSTCPGVGPQKVTGASLGLVSAYDGGEQVLVPAWFFAVEGSTQPVTVVAVVDRYLADPAPVGGGSAGSGSVGGSSGSAIPPGEPATPEPAVSTSDLPLPIGSPERLAVVAAYSVASDGRTLLVRATGGGCSILSGSAQETADTVTVSIARAQREGPCTADIRMVDVPVALDAPLADRAVLDARTGNDLKRD